MRSRANPEKGHQAELPEQMPPLDHALRAVERLVEEQRIRLDDLQRGQSQLEQALGHIRSAKLEPATPSERPKRSKTPPPEDVSQTPRTEVSSRTPRSQRREEGDRTPRDEAGRTPRNEADRTPRKEGQRTPRTGESSRMVRSNTEPDLTLAPQRSYSQSEVADHNALRGDPRCKDNGKQYGEWPAYPDWQDMPMRRFGHGYGKAIDRRQQEGHLVTGSLQKCGEEDRHMDPNYDILRVDMGLGNGRRKYEDKRSKTFENGMTISGGKDEDELGISRKTRWPVKDHVQHINDDSSTEVSSNRGSRHGRESSYADSQSAASRPRSIR